jgi:serine/threonine-protein kinase
VAVVNLPYIVMEHIEGPHPARRPGRGPPPRRRSALDIITGVLTALEYSHRIGIVHRDIKPANVMLTPIGDVKVMDFGIARAMADASSTMTQTQAVIGTAQYLSPEQARGEQVDTRSDLYSAGCLLYELLTGRPPFVADSPVAVAYQHVRERRSPPSRWSGHPGLGRPDRAALAGQGPGRALPERRRLPVRRRGRSRRPAGHAAVPVMHGSNATTQYVPSGLDRHPVAPAARDGPAALLGGDPWAGRSGAPATSTTRTTRTASTAAAGSAPGGRSPTGSLILAGIAVVAVSRWSATGPCSRSATAQGRGTRPRVAIPSVVGQTERPRSQPEGAGFNDVTSKKVSS